MRIDELEQDKRELEKKEIERNEKLKQLEDYKHKSEEYNTQLQAYMFEGYHLSQV